MNFERAERLKLLPPYVFVQIDNIKKQELAKGRRLLSLGVGDPDLPAPDFVVEKLREASLLSGVHQYPSYWGMIELRRAAARWYERRFGVRLDPESEVLTLIGSKEGLAHVALAYVNPGDAALVPDPGYPVYGVGTLFAGGRCGPQGKNAFSELSEQPHRGHGNRGVFFRGRAFCAQARACCLS